MTKIIAYHVRDEELDIIQKWEKEHGVEVKTVENQLSADNIHLAEGFDGLTTSQNKPLPDGVYETLRSLGIRQIAQRSAGYDVYDLEEATKNNIIVSNVAVYSPESIAEFTLTQALMLVRKVRRIEERKEERDFSWQPEIQGRLLGEMTVGIIGTGHIGRTAAKLFNAMGAEVLGYDIYPNDEAKEFLEYKESIEEVIKQADVVSLHMPATDDNHHQFNYDMFKQFKPTAYLINNARGSIVDTEGLIKALDDGLLAGAALDTYENESSYVPRDNRETGINDEVFNAVLDHDKIMYTPHIAYYTNVSVRNIMTIGLDSTLEVIQTGDTKNRVNDI
ncbi:D-2-hydroxyacid dehydrogenase [Alkalibacterium kapii]|uniref:Lactate dehydrogenase n=1 Tax=Alkalibacterium kapii TaxID=426704 RepID=A0A511ASF4_9LACT|nr:D-2-hydroxyacid dehydrogenase [Alkalibacterium kapii]GEK91134.1 lactate dehydrogenase [Alkalibacterium kapii]